MLSKCKKIVYSLTLFGVRYKRFVELECKQKLCGFPEDKNSNRRKVLICEFHKNCLKWSVKRHSICKSWFADRSFEPCSSVLSIFDNKSREDHFKSIDSSATELSTNMLIKYTVKLPTNALMKKNYVWMFVPNVLMKNCARALQNVSVHQAMKNELEITQSV